MTGDQAHIFVAVIATRNDAAVARTGAQRAVDPDLPGSDWVELLRTLVGSAISGVT